jgi:hypothetical protein
MLLETLSIPPLTYKNISTFAVFKGYAAFNLAPTFRCYSVFMTSKL